MSRHYAICTLFLLCCVLTGYSQVVRIDSVISENQEITLQYTVSDSLVDFMYKVDLYGLVGRDTFLLTNARNYPTDSLAPGTYRMRWDALAALERYRGTVRFYITARPGFRLTRLPEPSYKLGQTAKIQWYGGGAINEQFDLELLQFGNQVSSSELPFGVLSTSFIFPEEMKAGEGYSFRLVGRTSNIVWETAPFALTKIKERKWYIYAIPAALATGALAWWLLNGPLDEPQDLPE